MGFSLLAPVSEWSPPDIFPSLQGSKRIAIDVETYDPSLGELGPGVRRDGYVVGLAIAIDNGQSYYYPTRHRGGGNIDERVLWSWFKDETDKFAGDVVGAKLDYDLDYVMTQHGVTFPNVRRFYDVQIAEPLLDEHKLVYSLDSLLKEYLGETKREGLLREAAEAYGFGKTNADIKKNLWRLPASLVGPYAEGDVDRLFPLLDKQITRLNEAGLADLFDLESRLLPILVAMRRRGVRVDLAGAAKVRDRLIQERDSALAKVRRLAGPKAELMAPDSFAQALVDRGLDVGRTPKSGQYSVTSAWMKANEGDELVDAIQAGRKVNTIINTFIDGHVLGHSINGRIHCEFVQLKDGDGGTGARFSSRNPNLQNIPSRDDELGPMIRGLFIPEDGEDWEKQDESQMEYRLLVHFARGRGAAEARQMYHDDPKTDFHKYCATMMGVDQEDKSARKKVKGVNFASVYGAQVPRIAAVLGCDESEARKFLEQYNNNLPFKQATFDAAQVVARERGYVRSVLGRYARFPLWEPADNSRRKKDERLVALPRDKAEYMYGDRIVRAMTYKALNNLLQFSNADQVKKAMVDIWEAGLCEKNVLGPFLLQVHDELNYSVPRTSEGNEAVAEAKRLMEIAIPLRVPVVVEAKRGPNWGACE